MRDVGTETAGFDAARRLQEEGIQPIISFTNAIEPVERGWPGQGSCAKAVGAALPRSSRIGLLAHCGTGNLGDDATVATVLQHIKSRRPTAYLAGLSMDPEDTARRHGIPCFAMRQSVFPFERAWSSA